MLILFVDDDLDDYDLFCEAIKSVDNHTKCLHVVDGEKALRLLTEILVVLPDYIFLDVNMPIMGGEECLVKIKSDPRLKDIPTVVYTTTTNFGERQAFMKLGATDFIIKPGMFKELVEILKKILHR